MFGFGPFGARAFGEVPVPATGTTISYRRSIHMRFHFNRKRFRIVGAWPMLPKHAIPYHRTPDTFWYPEGPGKVKKRRAPPQLQDARPADPRLQK